MTEEDDEDEPAQSTLPIPGSEMIKSVANGTKTAHTEVEKIPMTVNADVQIENSIPNPIVPKAATENIEKSTNNSSYFKSKSGFKVRL
jgi:hypothetical protein